MCALYYLCDEFLIHVCVNIYSVAVNRRTHIPFMAAFGIKTHQQPFFPCVICSPWQWCLQAFSRQFCPLSSSSLSLLVFGMVGRSMCFSSEWTVDLPLRGVVLTVCCVWVWLLITDNLQTHKHKTSAKHISQQTQKHGRCLWLFENLPDS